MTVTDAGRHRRPLPKEPAPHKKPSLLNRVFRRRDVAEGETLFVLIVCRRDDEETRLSFDIVLRHGWEDLLTRYAKGNLERLGHSDKEWRVYSLNPKPTPTVRPTPLHQSSARPLGANQ